MSANYYYNLHHQNQNQNQNKYKHIHQINKNVNQNNHIDGLGGAASSVNNANSNNEVMFISQPPIQPIYPNGSHYQSLLGTPLIPVFTTDKQMTAKETNMKIVEEVIREKKNPELKDINEIYAKSRSKCELHPKHLSEKCRKCKEIRKEIIEKNEKVPVSGQFANTSAQNTNDQNNVTIQEYTNVNLNLCATANDKEIYLCTNSNYYGDAIFDNEFNANILSLDDNKHLQVYSGLREQGQERDSDRDRDPPFKIYGDHLTCNLNPLILNNILSCQYFKEEVALKSFEEIVLNIVVNVNYVEAWAVGMPGIPSTLFCCLYKFMLLKLTENQVKYLINNKDSFYLRCAGFLYVRYLSDPKDLWNILSPYLSDQQIFSPTLDQKEKITIGQYVKNLLNDLDYYGTRLPRLPTQVERDIKLKLAKLDNKSGDSQSERFNFNKSRNSRSRSRSHSKNNLKKYSRKHPETKTSRKRKSSPTQRRSRSLSKSSSSSKEAINNIKKKERESALARGKEYAVKPTSYKSSLFTKVPGHSKKRSRSRSPLNQNFEIVKLNKNKSSEENPHYYKKIEYSKEFIERQENLKKKYGYNNESKSLNSYKKSKDEIGPDVMRLG